MAIPAKYDKRMRETWGMHGVWFPGSQFAVGDIVQKAQDKTFQKVDSLSSFGIQFQTKKSEALKTGFKSASTKVTFIQGGGDVSPSSIDAQAAASVKIEFSSSDSFMVSAPIGSIETLENLLTIANKIGQISSWQHNKWFIIRSVFITDEFAVLGSKSKNRKIEFSGSGKAVLDFATFGLTAGITRSSTTQLDVEFIGTKGALAMDLAQVKKNGFVVMG